MSVISIESPTCAIAVATSARSCRSRRSAVVSVVSSTRPPSGIRLSRTRTQRPSHQAMLAVDRGLGAVGDSPLQVGPAHVRVVDRPQRRGVAAPVLPALAQGHRRPDVRGEMVRIVAVEEGEPVLGVEDGEPVGDALGRGPQPCLARFQAGLVVAARGEGRTHRLEPGSPQGRNPPVAAGAAIAFVLDVPHQPQRRADEPALQKEMGRQQRQHQADQDDRVGLEAGQDEAGQVRRGHQVEHGERRALQRLGQDRVAGHVVESGPALEQLGQRQLRQAGRQHGRSGCGGRGRVLARRGEHLAALAHDQDLAHGPCDLAQEPVQVAEQDVGADHPHEAVAGIDRCRMAHHRPGPARVGVDRRPVRSAFGVAGGRAGEEHLVAEPAFDQLGHAPIAAQRHEVGTRGEGEHGHEVALRGEVVAPAQLRGGEVCEAHRREHVECQVELDHGRGRPLQQGPVAQHVADAAGRRRRGEVVEMHAHHAVFVRARPQLATQRRFRLGQAAGKTVLGVLAQPADMVHGGAQDRLERDPLGARAAGQFVQQRAALAMELLQGERDHQDQQRQRHRAEQQRIVPGQPSRMLAHHASGLHRPDVRRGRERFDASLHGHHRRRLVKRAAPAGPDGAGLLPARMEVSLGGPCFGPVASGARSCFNRVVWTAGDVWAWRN